jgi:type III pantothenate kinase
MILALDVGNSHLFGGVLENGTLRLRFRRASRPSATSDELGVFLRSVLRENGSDPSRIDKISVCCVVPELLYSLRSCCRKYFDVDPFVLQAGAKTGLKILYRNPAEIGPDRIANSIAAQHLYPDADLIVIDFGTATTMNVVSRRREYLGGVILPGLRIAMEALERNTARLPTVEIVPPREALGRTTIDSIQSGLFFGTRAAVSGLVGQLASEAFDGTTPVTIGTGGFARLFEREKLFDVLIPDLVLLGLERALAMNPEGSKRWEDRTAEEER